MNKNLDQMKLFRPCAPSNWASVSTCFLFGLLSVFLVQTVSGQVVIKEKVEVDAARIDAASVAEFTAAQDGSLQIDLTQAFRLGSDAYPADTVFLKVFVNEGTPAKYALPVTEILSDKIFQRNWTIQFNEGGGLCFSSGGTFAVDSYDYFIDETIVVGDVLEGDVITTHFVTDLDTLGDDPGESILTQDGDRWEIKFEGFDTFCQTIGEELVINAEVVSDSSSLIVTAVQDTVSVLLPSVEINVLASDRLEPTFDPNFTVNLSLADTTLGSFALTEVNESGLETTIDSGTSLDLVPYDALDPMFRSITTPRFVYFIPNDTTTAAKRKRAALSQLVNSDGFATVQIDAVRSDSMSISGQGNVVIDMLTFDIVINENTTVLPDTVAVADSALVQAIASNSKTFFTASDGDFQVTLSTNTSSLPIVSKGTFVLQTRGTTQEEWTEQQSDTTLTVNYHSVDKGYEQQLVNNGDLMSFSRVLYVPDPVDGTDRYETVFIRSLREARNTHLGFDDVVADRYKLKLFMPPLPADSSYWPTIPVGGAEESFFTDTTVTIDNTLDGILIKYLNNGASDSEQEISVTEFFSPESNGHRHDSTALPIICTTTMRQVLYNLPIDAETRKNISDVTNGGQPGVGNILTNTDTSGDLLLNYQTPEIGGKVLLKVRSIVGLDTLQIESDSIVVRVPGLMQLEDGIHYDLVGGTPIHPGPRLDNNYPNHREPDTIHYGTQAVIDALEDIANAWYDLVNSESTQSNDQSPLRYNDISLQYGGVMDACGDWTPPGHTYHRVGRDVDVRATTQPLTIPRRGIFIKPTTYRNEEGELVTRTINKAFEDLVVDYGGFPRPEIHNPVHYHLYFYPTRNN